MHRSHLRRDARHPISESGAAKQLPRIIGRGVSSMRRGCCGGWRRALCWTVGVPLSLLLLLTVVVVWRALLFEPPAPSRALQAALKAAHSEQGIDVDRQMERAQRLAEGLAIRTISYEAGRQEEAELLRFHAFLRHNFPLVHGAEFIELTVVNRLSLLYEVRGSEPEQGRPPYLLTAHMDVVPVNFPDKWSSYTFGGINGSFVYGRGAIDHKGALLAIMEALEFMIEKGQRPRRTFYAAFGHDEELFGLDGARQLAKELRLRGVHEVDFLLDEGTPITTGILPGTTKPVALISVAEKGRVNVELTVSQPPGHSSFPPRHTAIGILASAVEKVEQNLQPSKFGTGAERALLEHIAPDLTFGFRVLFSNLWLFSWLVTAAMERNHKLNSLLRTTTAVTIFQGGTKLNVIPGKARAAINHRIHPGSSISEVVEHVRSVVNDPRVQVEALEEAQEPHPTSPFGEEALPFQLLAATTRHIFPDVLVAPALMVANTDTRWYLNHTRHVFRFLPVLMDSDDMARYHGVDERISVHSYHLLTDFYYRLMRNADVLTQPLPPDPPLDEL